MEELWRSETKKFVPVSKFVPNWGNNPLSVSKELLEEEKRWAESWKRRRLDSDRREIDEQRKGGGSPLRGNRQLQSTLLDEIDDPHGDYVRARARGHEQVLQYPWTTEDVRRHEAENKGLES